MIAPSYLKINTDCSTLVLHRFFLVLVMLIWGWLACSVGAWQVTCVSDNLASYVSRASHWSPSSFTSGLVSPWLWWIISSLKTARCRMGNLCAWINPASAVPKFECLSFGESIWPGLIQLIDRPRQAYVACDTDSPPQMLIQYHHQHYPPDSGESRTELIFLWRFGWWHPQASRSRASKEGRWALSLDGTYGRGSGVRQGSYSFQAAGRNDGIANDWPIAFMGLSMIFSRDSCLPCWDNIDPGIEPQENLLQITSEDQ